ncbi:MAG: hypothetical protein RR379_08650 [Clostridia bacterium]
MSRNIAVNIAVLLCGMGSFAVAEQAQSITLMASQNWIKDVDRELFKAFEKETGIEVKILVTPDNGYDTLRAPPLPAEAMPSTSLCTLQAP